MPDEKASNNLYIHNELWPTISMFMKREFLSLKTQVMNLQCPSLLFHSKYQSNSIEYRYWRADLMGQCFPTFFFTQTTTRCLRRRFSLQPWRRIPTCVLLSGQCWGNMSQNKGQSSNKWRIYDLRAFQILLFLWQSYLLELGAHTSNDS